MGSQKLLDHGYIEVIESWGSDERIIEAARMSTGKGFLGWGSTTAPGDEKLLAYLYNNKHATPFEMGGLVIEVQAPIFVFREWHRHRTQSYNEMSARYVPLPDMNYIPSVDRLLLISKTNKQAGAITDVKELTVASAIEYQVDLEAAYVVDQCFYEKVLKLGVPKELARIHLPVARYSRMRASANLRNWLAFLTLRQASQAQWEIRQYANVLNTMLVERFPRTMELFNASANI